jgi:hypothetical protein
MENSVKYYLLIGVFLLMGFIKSAIAQDIASGSATATVQTAISITANQPLDFGQIFQGVPKAIGANNDDSCAIFTIAGQGGAGINLQLSLPEYISLSDGSARMNIIFNSTTASVDTSNTATPSTMIGADGWINQNPYLLPAGAVIGSPGNNTKIYLGGKVVPSGNQKPGNYSGDIVLSVSYNGS